MSVPRRGAVHERRLGAGRDHHECVRLRASLGQHGASAYSILLDPGFAPAQRCARSNVRSGSAASGRSPSRRPQRHAARQRALSREALASLTEIATLIPIAAVLAMAAAMGALVWQRRPRLAKLKLEGLPRADCGDDPAGELAAAQRRLPDGGRSLGSTASSSRIACSRDVVNFPVVYSITALPALQQPRARDRDGAGDPRDPRATSRLRSRRPSHSRTDRLSVSDIQPASVQTGARAPEPAAHAREALLDAADGGILREPLAEDLARDAIRESQASPSRRCCATSAPRRGLLLQAMCAAARRSSTSAGAFRRATSRARSRTYSTTTRTGVSARLRIGAWMDEAGPARASSRRRRVRSTMTGSDTCSVPWLGISRSRSARGDGRR